MYCTNCGEKLADGAVFCGACGCRVKDDDAVRQTPAAGQGFSPVSSQAQQPQFTVTDGARQTRPSFASFLMERRQVGKAMVPTFAIILAMLIAAAGTAYALVKAYEVFVEPQLERRNEDKTASAKQSKKQTVEVTNKKAHGAYENVIARYKDFIDYCEDAGQRAGNYDSWALDRDDGDRDLSQIFIYDSINAPTDIDYFYAFKDLDGDGVDELLIGSAPAHEGINGANGILDIYHFINGKAEPLIKQAEGFSEWGKADYEGFQVQGEGQEYALCEDGLIKFSCTQDVDASTLYLKLENGAVTIQDALQYSNYDDGHFVDGFLVRFVLNGGKLKKETVAEQTAIDRMKALEKKHPVSDFEKPGASSKMWNMFFGVKTADGPDASESVDGDAKIGDEASFITTAKRELRVPDDDGITYEISEKPCYWDDAGIWLWDVAFYRNGQFVAGADCGSDGYPCTSIMAYRG